MPWSLSTHVASQKLALWAMKKSLGCLRVCSCMSWYHMLSNSNTFFFDLPFEQKAKNRTKKKRALFFAQNEATGWISSCWHVRIHNVSLQGYGVVVFAISFFHRAHNCNYSYLGSEKQLLNQVGTGISRHLCCCDAGCTIGGKCECWLINYCNNSSFD